MHYPVRSESYRGETYPRLAAPALLGDAELPATSRTVELAAELLDMINESELEDFLGGLVAETARDAGGTISASTGRALVDVLRKTAERTLPTLITALDDGTEAAIPERSTAATAARVFGLELEGMSAEDRDFEIARQLVRFAQVATIRAANARAQALPAATVDAAVASAAREFAPGLLPPDPALSTGLQTGPWIRRGSTVELIGVLPPRS